LDVVQLEQGYLLRKDLKALEAAELKSVRLLPLFDPYVVGAPRTGGLFPAAHKKRIYRNQGWISPVILIDGHVEGTWRHERKPRGWEVSLQPLKRPPRKLLDPEAEELARFYGLPLLKLTWPAVIGD